MRTDLDLRWNRTLHYGTGKREILVFFFVEIPKQGGEIKAVSVEPASGSYYSHVATSGLMIHQLSEELAAQTQE